MLYVKRETSLLFSVLTILLFVTKGYFRECKGHDIWPMGKSAPRKTFEILFWPKTSKNDHSREGMRLLVCRGVWTSAEGKVTRFILYPTKLYPEILIQLFSKKPFWGKWRPCKGLSVIGSKTVLSFSNLSFILYTVLYVYKLIFFDFD